MTVSLSGAENDGARAQSVFPLYVFLARLVSDVSNAEVIMHVHLFKLSISHCISFSTVDYYLLSNFNIVFETKKVLCCISIQPSVHVNQPQCV